jgi:hypothetical protein
MTTRAFLERRLGDHLLVAQLSEDCLGTVFRALHAEDDNRFLRLRLLQSPELSPPEVFEAVRKNARWASSLSHKAIVQRAELGIADGVPFVAWQESTGWTLDLLLARLRATGMQLPVEHALLIAARVASALEHAWSMPMHGERIRHGLLWPGFVSISNDAEVRTGGFGLAEAVLPSLRKGRLARDIAPYVAPEVREGAAVDGSGSDTYSLGVLLLELLTSRRPTLGAPLTDFRSDDPFPPDIRPILERSFAPAGERFASAAEMHRALQELLATTSYYSVSTVSLALFLYKLLNPESHSLPITDAESTNPVEGDLPPAPPGETAIDAPRRRTADRALEPSTSAAAPRFLESMIAFWKPRNVPAIEAQPPASISARPSPNPQRRLFAWLATAAAIALGVGLWSARREHPSTSAAAVAAEVVARSAMQRPTNTQVVPASASLETLPAPASATLTRPHAASRRTRPQRIQVGMPGGSLLPAPEPASPEERRGVENLRFEAGIARIEAERLEASKLAADEFREARTREREGEKLFRTQSYAQALAAFDRATGLYRLAENISRERRVERVKIASD